MFDNLMSEVEYLRKARPDYGVLEAIMFIDQYQKEYPSEVRRELRDFLREGARMMAQRSDPTL